MSHACKRFSTVVTRRAMLQTSAAGFGGLALAGLLAELSRGADPSDRAGQIVWPRIPDRSPRKRLIFPRKRSG